ncbi:phosphotransferase [Brevibacterium sediminis]|uniref:phosphotransferase family protein n=1 Tax=Brevibacterium sediminis TaxID=1857024 RepID=UPI0035BE2538|nr:phosphotransferase [Brevibacterium sediminis]
MLAPPEQIGKLELIENIEYWYGIDAGELEFQPSGEDSWNFRIGSLWWVSVRRDFRGHVPPAYAAARELADSGIDFIIAPTRNRDSNCTSYLARSGLPLVVYPWSRAVPIGQVRSPYLASCLADLLAVVHRSSVEEVLPKEDFKLAAVESLYEHLTWADRVVNPANYSSDDDLHNLLSNHRAFLLRLLDDTVRIGAILRERAPSLFLTHGDPSATNFLKEDGKILLVDWGGACLAPAERDWFHLRKNFGSAPLGDLLIEEFYRKSWILTEVDEYATCLRKKSVGEADASAMRNRMRRWLAAAVKEYDR